MDARKTISKIFQCSYGLRFRAYLSYFNFFGLICFVLILFLLLLPKLAVVYMAGNIALGHLEAKRYYNQRTHST